MCLKMFPLSCKGDVHQWLGLLDKKRSTYWRKESGTTHLVEAGEDWDEVDGMVVPPQAEVLCGRPTWHGGRCSETIQNCLRFIHVKRLSQNKHILSLISHSCWIHMKKATAVQNRSRGLGEICASSNNRTWENCTEASHAAEYAGWGNPRSRQKPYKGGAWQICFEEKQPRWLLLN